jgi:uncharacterized protein YwqG
MKSAINVLVAMIYCFLPATVVATDPPEISKKIVERLLQPWAAVFEKTRRNVIFIDLKKSEDLLRASKIGGRPYLPPGHKLPVDSTGAEMFLLAQINCAELPAGKSFPKDGILQFFIAASDHYGANFREKIDEETLSNQKDFRVVYHPNSTAESEEFKYPPLNERPRDLPIDPKKTLLMTFREGKELITTYDFGFPQIVGDETYSWIEKLAKQNNLDEDDLFESVAESLEPTAFVDKLGGYPAFVQEDPRSIGSKKKLLLQLNSHNEDGVEMMWGDGGVAGFFIDPADLERRDFSKVMYTWDCS